MKNTIYRIALLVGVIAATSFAANAAPEEDGDGARKGRGGPRAGAQGRPEMTEEQKAERKAAMEKRRAEWEALPEAEKEKRKAEMAKRRAEWEALTPEEREAKTKERRATMEALMKKYDTDGTKGLSAEERKALSEDPEFKKMGMGMRSRRPGGRQGGAEGGRPEGGRRGGKPEGDKPEGKPAPKE